MSERPGILFGALLVIASAVAALLLSALAILGATGVASLVVTLVGAFSACVFFLAQLHAVPLASLALVAVTLASLVALVRATARYRREQQLVRALPLVRTCEGQLAELAQKAGAELWLASAQRPAAFCVGLLRPRIVVTSGLLARLSPDEQAAVIWHEAQHARLREPLRCLIAEIASSAFFWLPTLRDVRERYRLARELDADRVAITQTSRRALAGALYEVIVEPAYAGTIGLADAAAARIDRIIDPAAKLPRLFRRSRLIVSGVAVTTLVVLLATPAHLSLNERGQLDSMLTSSSLHGLPGMAAGFAMNTVLIAGVTLGSRRFAARRVSLGVGRWRRQDWS